MLTQPIPPPIVARIAPDGVNMVGLVLGVVVFDEQASALHSVIMWSARFVGTCPRQSEGIFCRLFLVD